MNLDRFAILLLADNDIFSLIAILAFGLISAIGSAIKKKAEAKKDAGARTAAMEDYEQAELHDEELPMRPSYPPARPVPPIPKMEAGRKSRSVRVAKRHEPTPDDVLAHLNVQIARKGAANKPQSTVPVSGTVRAQPSPRTPEGKIDSSTEYPHGRFKIRDASTLRTAFVWSEILRPPVSLREGTGGWQDPK